MFTRALCLLPLCGMLLASSPSPAAQGPPSSSAAGECAPFDFTALDHFWKIVGSLQRDEEPSAAAWDSLFATPGYAALTRSEFRPAFFREAFALTYRAARAAERRAAQDTSARLRPYLRHYERIAARRHELARWRQTPQSTAQPAEAVRLAQTLLPDGTVPAAACPPPTAIAASPQVLARVDSLLGRWAAEPARRDSLGREVRRALPRSGHPTGFYMASAIRHWLGLPALVASVGDPVAFFERYERAAQQAQGAVYRLSPAAREALRTLDREPGHAVAGRL